MSVTVVVERVTAWGGSGQRTFNRYPKRLSVKCYETNVASIIKECLIRPVMWMVPESRPTPESSSSAYLSTASKENEVLQLTTCILLPDEHKQTTVSRTNIMYLMSDDTLPGALRA